MCHLVSMRINKVKLLIGLVLLPVTGVYCFMILSFMGLIMSGIMRHSSYFDGTFMMFLLLMGVFGLFGLIGLWLLLIFNNFENHYKRVITMIFIGMGAFAALSVSYITFADYFGMRDSIVGFGLSWGLWFFALVALYLTKRKLFPKL